MGSGRDEWDWMISPRVLLEQTFNNVKNVDKL